MIDDVEVWDASGETETRAGILRPSFMGGRSLASSSFEYDAEFLRAGWQISPDLPLRPGRSFVPENSTLPGAISDAAPDDWGRRLILADHRLRSETEQDLPRALGEFDYLLGVSDHTRIGALRFRRSGEWLSSRSGVANVHDLGRIVDAAQRYEADSATDEDIAYLGDVATSPGGARPKANVVLADGRLAIAKLPHSKDGAIDVERWEAVALTIARRAGLRVPTWSLEPAGTGRAVLLSERFDRTGGGGRLGYMSARTAFELGAHDDGVRLTYEDFADVIDAWSGRPADDLREMFGRIALTVLMNNVDDHWRNHAFLRNGDGWRLSPAFDVNPSLQRGIIDSRAISDRDDPRRRDLRNLLAIASAFRLRDTAGREVVRAVARAVEGWDAIAASLGIDAVGRRRFTDVLESPQLDWALGL